MPSTGSTRRCAGSPARTGRPPIPPISSSSRSGRSPTSSPPPKKSPTAERRPAQPTHRTGGRTMPIDVLMPALSPTMTEGNLVKWHKKEGDTVKSGDVLAEIETDKATMAVEAVEEGILGKIVVPSGTEAVKVNAVIALILEEGEDKSALAGAGKPAPAAAAPAE